MNLQETLYISRLFDIYKNLLTKKQQQIVKGYVDYNGSLSEIANEFNITRQAVFDLLKRTIKKLEEYEQKLKICKKLDRVYNKIPKLAISGLTKEEQDIIIKTIKSVEE